VFLGDGRTIAASREAPQRSACFYPTPHHGEAAPSRAKEAWGKNM